MKLSVILIGWNSLGYLQQCLPSLEAATAGILHEIIYVDNDSQDETHSYISQYFPAIKYIQNPKNEGVSKARNIGIKLSTGQYIWILDSDTIVNRKALEEMLHYMEMNPDAGICACKLIDEAGNVQNSCRKYPTVSAKTRSALHSIFKKIGIQIYKQENENVYDIFSGNAFEVDYVIGACQLIRREVIEKIGLLDEKIFYGPEDADFCLRAYRAGWKVIYLPFISIIHSYQRVTSKKVFNKLTLQHLKSLFYYFKKHNNHGLS